MKSLKYIAYSALGVAILVAAGVYVDRHPSKIGTNGTAGTIHNYGSAPELEGISNWINSSPLTMSGLRGKVVLVDFWTYSCINCIRTLPYVTKWYSTYKDKGLIVIGVHTPEFTFEKNAANVQDAVKRFGILYPVAQDNSYGTWNAYSNEYWPADYLVDQKGNIVYESFGEGDYSGTENAIRTLLGLSASATADSGPDLSHIGSPEMYFEPSRLANLASNQRASAGEKQYTSSGTLALNTFALDGYWKFVSDGAVTTRPNAKIILKFHSANLYVVAQSATPTTLRITVDGQAQQNVTVSSSQLYTLFTSSEYTDHVVEIDVPNPGFQVFTFTFG